MFSLNPYTAEVSGKNKRKFSSAGRDAAGHAKLSNGTKPHIWHIIYILDALI